MSDDKRKNARTQGRYSGGDKEFSSKRYDKHSSKMPHPADNNKGEKRKSPSVGSRVQSGKEVKYEEDNKYSFKEYEPKKKPEELRFVGEYELSKTENGISRLIYDPDFMKMAEADEIMTILKDSTKWCDQNIVIKGVEYPQPRLVAWYGPHPYTYAGATLDAGEMPSTVYNIKEKVEASLRKHGINVELNSVLLNLYRNEKDSVAWHSDDEFSLGVYPTIASVSLGETRKFEMRPKSHVKDVDPNDILYVNLTHGSLIVMDGCMQEDWLHRVPKEFHNRSERINLTFRTIFPIDQLPPEMPRARNTSFAKSLDVKKVHQRELKLDEESFPPLGGETCDKQSKSLPKETVSICPQQPAQRKSRKEELWDDEMSHCGEDLDENSKIQNNLNKETSSNTLISSSEEESSQTDINSNTKEPMKLNITKFSPSEYIKTEHHSDGSEIQESNNLESNDASPENKPDTLKTEIEEHSTTANSGKKYTLNADAPVFLPQNKFETYTLPELAEYCKICRNIKNEDLPSLAEVLFTAVHNSEYLFIERDFHEFRVYSKLNDGTLSNRHLKIILERISSMIKNAYYQKNHKRYRHQDENYQKPRQSYSRSQRY